MQERAAQSWENFYPRPPRGGRPLRVEASAASIPDFYPRPPRGGRRPSFSSPRIRKRFLSTPSARRATELRRQHRLPTPNFYPRPPRGGRPPLPRLRVAVIKNFYPRPPRGGRHISLVCPQKTALFLSTPSARRATHIAVLPSKNCVISIHALREEGDQNRKQACLALSQFLSTPSARRATTKACANGGETCHFYPRPPRGGRR